MRRMRLRGLRRARDGEVDFGRVGQLVPVSGNRVHSAHLPLFASANPSQGRVHQEGSANHPPVRHSAALPALLLRRSGVLRWHEGLPSANAARSMMVRRVLANDPTSIRRSPAHRTISVSTSTAALTSVSIAQQSVRRCGDRIGRCSMAACGAVWYSPLVLPPAPTTTPPTPRRQKPRHRGASTEWRELGVVQTGLPRLPPLWRDIG